MDRETTKQAELSVNFIDFIVGPFFMALTNLLPRVHECCGLMRDNRAAWTTLVCDDLHLRHDLDEAKKAETIGKWRARESAFNDVVAPLIATAKAQTGEGEAAAEGGNRRGSVNMLGDMMRRTKEGAHLPK
jgi:hypothetical protein